jgi:hypothetical protein
VRVTKTAGCLDHGLRDALAALQPRHHEVARILLVDVRARRAARGATVAAGLEEYPVGELAAVEAGDLLAALAVEADDATGEADRMGAVARGGHLALEGVEAGRRVEAGEDRPHVLPLPELVVVVLHTVHPTQRLRQHRCLGLRTPKVPAADGIRQHDPPPPASAVSRRDGLPATGHPRPGSSHEGDGAGNWRR